jgi:hypothetical protein
MALQCSYTDPHGTTPLPAAYCRIAEINLNYVQKVGRLTVNIWKDKSAFDANLLPVDQVAYPISEAGTPPSTSNPAGFPTFDQIVGEPIPANVVSGPTVIGTTTYWEVSQAILYSILQTQEEFKNATIVA